MNHFNLPFKIRHILLGLILMLSVILRLPLLDHFPPSLYTDEANQGYNAYSILKTGKDEHGKFLPVSLRSFGDWKPPLQTYLMIPFISFFGLNGISLRMPSAILGVFTILFSYLLVKLLFCDEKNCTKIALLTAFYLSISPWHILQSRSAMLVMVALFFLEGGILFFIKSIKKSKYIILSAIFFALSIYSYYGLRVIAPLMVLSLLVYFHKEIEFRSKEMFIALFIGILIVLPLFISSFTEPDVILGRAKTVSVFYDQGVKLRQWEMFTQDGINYSNFLSRFFHNNIYMYGKDIIERYLSHFDGKFLFLTGDTAQPFQIPGMGILYLIDSILIITGIVVLTKIKYRFRWLILIWFVISFIPAAFTFMTPTNNRTFNAVVPYAVVIALGIAFISGKQTNKLPALLITLIYILSFSWFMKQYFIVLPIQNSAWWNWGWREIVEYTINVEQRYENIVVSGTGGMPYIYFLFYKQYDPALYQKEAIRTYVSDRFGFEHVDGFGKYFFRSDFNWKYVKENLQPKTLYVVPVEQAKLDINYNYLVKYPDNMDAFKIFEYDK